MFQMGGIGPMMGQANVCSSATCRRRSRSRSPATTANPAPVPVLDLRLEDHEYLANDTYSIADIANWAWVRTHRWSGVEVDDLPHLKRWLAAIRAGPRFSAASRYRRRSARWTRAATMRRRRRSPRARTMVEVGQSREGGV